MVKALPFLTPSPEATVFMGVIEKAQHKGRVLKL
jgi:hypothetical protein